ncbi:hypothetical protein B0T24DRAFT_656487 [Lasiosphaeria ovina]|uniref:Cation-transporting P-type ATPase N-terminal domain-containing protein n=1 Tax=Lasiosphaeria ovina TaxID=92902 RepID=A0AAE0KHW9_9PEZI|nr:hypothetical protein B0T24DRAFT_656487 [Lasiosphaeria ovina]
MSDPEKSEVGGEPPQNPTSGADQRIQFAPTVRPPREDAIAHVQPTIPSIPPILSGKERDRRARQDEHEKKHVDIDEHLMPHADVAERYRTSINMKKPRDSLGLTTQQAEELLREHDPNILTPPKKRHPILKYLDALKSLFNLLLIFAAILILVAFLNSFIDFYPQQKSQALLESFLNMIPAKLPTPADILVFSASDCKVDNSSLTGESEPQDRIAENEMRNPLEATNVMFNSTLVVSGEAYGIIIRTGDGTVLGQIARLTAGEEKLKSPLTVEIGNFVKIIATVAIITALIFFGISFPVNNNNASLAINFAISIAWVPEGLPATVTMLLTIAAKRMAAQNVLVKDLQGTCGELYETSRGAVEEKSIAGPDKPGVNEILHISALEREILSDATKSSLMRYAADQLDNIDAIGPKYPKVFELTFTSDTKWHMSIHKKSHANGALTLYMKGAPERVWRLCSWILSGPGDESVPLTEEHKKAYDEAYKHMAGRGHRVLGFAEMLLPGDQYPGDFVFDKKAKNYSLGNFIFAGLASLQDPPKHGVREAIGRCRAARIKVIMVIGDHPLTAEAIGRKINLMLGETKAMVAKRTGKPIDQIAENEYDAVVVHGEQIDSLTDADWDKISWRTEIIFARTSPKHKLEIVRRAQSMGHIVGVTGDGVNDSPALKKADLGIAMNKSGSDVSKEAASMILLDDNFASIVRGIEEGRLIFVNLKKSIKYTISHSTPEVIPSLLNFVIPIPLPLPPMLILVIDLGFELIAALSFAWDPPETREGLMKLPPRKPVTPETSNIFRRRALRQTRSYVDEESGVIHTPEPQTKLQEILHNLRELFTKSYWVEKLESTGGEVLVDGALLSWAYLEIGLIEATGSLGSFFMVLHSRGISPHDAYIMQKDGATYNGIDGPAQADILAEAQSMYYWAVMTMQMFNLFACKTRFTLPFGRYMFANRATFYCIIAGAALAAFIIYTPGVEVVFETSRSLLPLYWLIPIAFGFVLILYASLRMIISRRANPIKWNPEIQGLQMFPTIRTVRTMSRTSTRSR